MALDSNLLVYNYQNSTFFIKTLNHYNSIIKTKFQNNLKPTLGSIYYAQITQFQPALNCYFVDLGNNYYALLKNNHQTKSILGKPSLGSKFLAVLTKEDDNYKYPIVSAKVIIDGFYCTFTPHKNVISFSSSLLHLNKDCKLKVINAINNNFLKNFSLLVKKDTNINNLLTEIRIKQALWTTITSEKRFKLGLIYAPSSLINLLYEEDSISVNITTNSLNLITKFKNDVINTLPFFNVIYIYNNNHEFYLKYINKLEKQLTNEITIDNNIILHIYNTKALTFIDIDFKGNYNLNQEDSFIKANLESVEYIVNIIKLRNISGQVFIDTLKIKSKESKLLLLEKYKLHFTESSLPVNILGFTRLGVLEIEIQKKTQTTTESIFDHCNKCLGNGKILNYNFLNLKTIMLINKLLEINPIANITIKSSEENLENFKNTNKSTIKKITNNTKINFIIDNKITNNIIVY